MLPTIASNLNQPEGLAVGSDDIIYVADTGNNAVKKVVGNTITTIANGFRDVRGIGVDSANNVYVSDRFFGTVKKIIQ